MSDPGTAAPAPRTPTLGERATSGVLWSVAQKWAMRLGGLLTVVILARLLGPEEFGLVAIAMAFIPVVYLLADLGFSTYVVQAEDLSSRVLSTAFWYALAAGGTFAAVLLLAAPAIAASFGSPQAGPVFAALAPTVLLVALSSVPVALLRRRLEFRALAVQSFVAALLGQAIAIAAAFAGFGVWALVAQLVVNHFVIAVLAWGFSRFRPTLEFSGRQFVAMARFGVNVIAVEFVALTRAWAEAAIVTSALGTTGLGYLNIAQRLIQSTQDLSAAAVVPVSTVVFAQVRGAVERLAGAYVRASETVNLIVMPVMVGVAVAAPLAIPLMFGDQWDLSVTPARALAVAGIFTLGASLDNGLFYGAGKPGRWFAYAVVVDALTVGATLYLVRYGLVGVSLGFVGVALVATVVRWFLVARLLRTTTLRVARPFLSSAVAAVAGAAAGLGALALAAPLPDLAALGVVGVAILAAHALAARLVAPVAFRATLDLVVGRLRRRRGAAPDAPAARPETVSTGAGDDS